MKEFMELINKKINKKKDFFERWYKSEGIDEVDEKINKATQLAFDDAISAVEDAYKELKDKSSTKTWTIEGYIGFNDYDGPSDNNLSFIMEMDKSVSKEEIEYLLFSRYKRYRTIVLNVSELKEEDF
jgi:hypothetical protein